MNRRSLVLGAGGTLLLGSLTVPASARNADLPIRIALSPTCGCCKDWVAHLNQNGFQTTIDEVPDINRRKIAAGIPTEFWSCHTAFIGEYFIEGHVPAQDIKRLLLERPSGRGLAVPGMPVGSPGMEMPNVAADRYKTLLVGLDNRAAVWALH
ncbi:MAG: DUF411 domain-containing protein [Paracoccaceae bacterium]